MAACVPVTVLMPVHNARRYLWAALQSILRQDIMEFEFLIIDDGCSDGSQRLLGCIDDPRVRILRQENRGVVAALNRGLDEARGELVARMDADDIALPHRLRTQMRFLAENPEVHLLGSRFTYIDSRGRALFSPSWPCGDAEIRRALTRYNCFTHPTVMFRRRSALAVGGYRRELQYQEDYDLWLRLIERHRAAQVPSVLLFYRLSNDSVSFKNRQEQSTVLDALVKELHRQREADGRDLLQRGNRLDPLRADLQRKSTRRMQRRRWARQMYGLGHGCLEAGRRAAALRFAMEAVWHDPAARWNWLLLGRSGIPEWMHDALAYLAGNWRAFKRRWQ